MPADVEEAVILGGGYNSRMMPIAKVIPKVMLPLGHRPALYYLIDECFKSGIKKILLVVRSKDTIIDQYFKPDADLEKALQKRGRQDAIRELALMASWYKSIQMVVQPDPHGEAHALYQVKNLINRQKRLAILFGDTVYQAHIPAIKQIIEKPHVAELIFGMGRFVINGDAFKYFTHETIEGLPNYDKRIVDLFASEQMSFHSIEGNKFSTGTIEEYHESVCRWPD